MFLSLYKNNSIVYLLLAFHKFILMYGGNKMKQNLAIFLNLLCASLFIISLVILDKEPIFAVCCFTWSIFYFIRSNKFISKIRVKAFTLIELIAVIVIMAVLVSMVMALQTSTMNTDARRINGHYMKLQAESSTTSDIIPSELPNNLYNEVTLSETIYFKQGAPVKIDGSPIIDCRITIKDVKGKEEDYVIRINTFTGKISFY